jgi:hypothetical protein
LFFVPTADFLENAAVGAEGKPSSAAQPAPPTVDGSLGIGSLKKGGMNE